MSIKTYQRVLKTRSRRLAKSHKPAETQHDFQHAVGQGTVAVDEPNRPFRLDRKMLALAGSLIIITIFVLSAWMMHIQKVHNAENIALQAAAQKELNVAINSADDQLTISSSTQLIDGKLDKKFRIDNKELAIDYLYRAASYLNLQQYNQALQDYQQALKLDSNSREAALVGEVTAGYRLGQRQQLIPPLQQLAQIARSSDNDQMLGTPQDFEYYITAIQQNKPISL
jgi:tetratricopeptide (TPR) repeat protein